MTERTLRGRTAIVGIGETTYYRHGQAPDAEFKLALQAVVAACEDAGISPHDIDGFASYGNDRSEAGRLAAALGVKEFRFSNMFWGGGGGGGGGGNRDGGLRRRVPVPGAGAIPALRPVGWRTDRGGRRFVSVSLRHHV